MLDVIDAVFSYVNEMNITSLTMQAYADWWKKRNNIELQINQINGKMIFENLDVEMILTKNHKSVNFISQKEVNLSNLQFKKIEKIERTKNISLTRMFHWRDLLYNYESWQGRRNR